MKMLKQAEFFILTAIMAFTLAACGAKGAPETVSSSGTAPLSSVQPSGSSGAGVSGAAAGKVEVSFPYVRQDGIATNQFAVWIESEDGKLVKTLFVTRFTASGGYAQRAQAIPTWVERSGLKQGTAEGVDAVSGATPNTGNLKYTWDCKDAHGTPVPAGKYRFLVEGTLRWDDRVLFTGTIPVGSGRATAEATPQYSTETAKASKMLGTVTAVYLP